VLTKGGQCSKCSPAVGGGRSAGDDQVLLSTYHPLPAPIQAKRFVAALDIKKHPPAVRGKYQRRVQVDARTIFRISLIRSQSRQKFAVFGRAAAISQPSSSGAVFFCEILNSFRPRWCGSLLNRCDKLLARRRRKNTRRQQRGSRRRIMVTTEY